MEWIRGRKRGGGVFKKGGGRKKPLLSSTRSKQRGKRRQIRTCLSGLLPFGKRERKEKKRLDRAKKEAKRTDSSALEGGEGRGGPRSPPSYDLLLPVGVPWKKRERGAWNGEKKKNPHRSTMVSGGEKRGRGLAKERVESPNRANRRNREREKKMGLLVSHDRRR